MFILEKRWPSQASMEALPLKGNWMDHRARGAQQQGMSGGHRLLEVKWQLETREEVFPLSVVRYQKSLSKAVVHLPSLELFRP